MKVNIRKDTVNKASTTLLANQNGFQIEIDAYGLSIPSNFGDNSDDTSPL